MRDPLVPQEADMRGLAFMPLDVARLLDSDLFALSTGEEFKAAVALWCKAWTQIPAGSLPDDDRVLAHLSGSGSRWRKVKAMALRGFEKCSDGRLYHVLISEKVKEAWAMRLRQRERSGKGNAKRWRRDGDRNPLGDVNDTHSDPHGDQKPSPRGPETIPTEMPGGIENDPKGQGQGQGQGLPFEISQAEALSVPSERTPAKTPRNVYPQDFLAFWNFYPTDPNMSKKEAFDVWKRLPAEERDAAIRSVPGFLVYCREHPDYRPVHACRFLAKKRSEGFLEAGLGSSEPRVDFGGGVMWPERSVKAVIDHWRRDPTTWPRDRLGPPPGEPGCKLPAKMMEAA